MDIMQALQMICKTPEAHDKGAEATACLHETSPFAHSLL